MRRSNSTRVSRVLAEALRKGGFPLVVESVFPGERAGGAALDAVAYDVLSGELMLTTAVVDARGEGPLAVERALSDLSTARDILGTSIHYVVAGSQWMLANDGLTSATPVAGPSPARASRYRGDHVVVGDERVLTDLLRTRLLKLQSELRNRGFETAAVATSHLLEELVSDGMHVGGLVVDPDARALWSALVSTVRNVADRQPQGLESVSPAGVADGVANLLGPLRAGRAFDPFCGLGSFLWAVGQRARGDGVNIELSGQEIGADISRLATAMGSFAPGQIRITTGDSFQTVGQVDDQFDYVLSAPPFGLRLRPDQAHTLPLPSRRSETAAIQLAANLLAPSGRAVLHLPNSWLFNGDAAEVRGLLSGELCVLAIIGLPAGAVPGSSIQSNLLVFDKRRSGPDHQTFIAQLGNDWAAHLAEGGGALTAYLSYLADLPST